MSFVGRICKVGLISERFSILNKMCPNHYPKHFPIEKLKKHLAHFLEDGTKMENILRLSHLLKKDNKLNTEAALFLFNHTNKTSINNAKNWLLKDHDIIIPKATFFKKESFIATFW